MIDTSTGKKLYVSTDGNAGPYIMVPVEQIEQVRRILDVNAFSYWVDEFAISLNDRPKITVVNLHTDVDAQKVQGLLDQTS